jgi:hypothetical protein
MTKPKQSTAREVYARLLKRGHSASNIRESARRYFEFLDDQGEDIPTLAEFLTAYELECETEIGAGYLLN